MENFHTFVDYILITKRWEYGIAFGFMIMFIFFYTFLKAPSPVRERLAEGIKRVSDMIQGFLVPDKLFFHQGHAWTKVDSNDTASVGMDDFAQKLVGKIDSVELPEVGSIMKQGEKGWSMTIDSKKIDMLSPIDGKVIDINRDLIESPKSINEDPYGKGWLFKVQSSRIPSNLKNLFTGKLAKKWTEKVVDDLTAEANFQLGLVLGDGGLPIDGMAKSLDSENWDRIVRGFFLTEE